MTQSNELASALLADNHMGYKALFAPGPKQLVHCFTAVFILSVNVYSQALAPRFVDQPAGKVLWALRGVFQQIKGDFFHTGGLRNLLAIWPFGATC